MSCLLPNIIWLCTKTIRMWKSWLIVLESSLVLLREAFEQVDKYVLIIKTSVFCLVLQGKFTLMTGIGAWTIINVQKVGIYNMYQSIKLGPIWQLQAFHLATTTYREWITNMIMRPHEMQWNLTVMFICYNKQQKTEISGNSFEGSSFTLPVICFPVIYIGIQYWLLW